MSAALDLTLRATVVLSLAWITVACLRRRPASLRAFVWTIGIGGILVVPVVSQVTPVWTIAAWQRPAVIEEPIASSHENDIVAQKLDEPAAALMAAPEQIAAEPTVPSSAAGTPAAIDWTRGALLEMSDLSEGNLLGILNAGRSTNDHYVAETLRKVLRHRGTSERVRSAVLAAAEQLQRHYRDEIQREAARIR